MIECTRQLCNEEAKYRVTCAFTESFLNKSEKKVDLAFCDECAKAFILEFLPLSHISKDGMVFLVRDASNITQEQIKNNIKRMVEWSKEILNMQEENE